MRKRKTWIVIFLIASFSGNVCLAAEGAPVAVVAEPLYRHPPIAEKETVVHDFIIKNTGDQELRLLKVRPG